MAEWERKFAPILRRTSYVPKGMKEMYHHVHPHTIDGRAHCRAFTRVDLTKVTDDVSNVAFCDICRRRFFPGIGITNGRPE